MSNKAIGIIISAAVLLSPLVSIAQVACTADAMQCPDGSYVGRTGPNCQFAACPTKVKPPSSSFSPVPCIVPSRYLYRGVVDTAPDGDVFNLQVYLGELGLFTPTPIGIFGPLTFSAVVKYQSA